MTSFVSDAFTGTNDTELAAYNAAWSKVTGQTGSLTLFDNRVRASEAVAYYVRSETPASADYDVSADIYISASTSNVAQAGVLARFSAAAMTGYRAMLRNDGSATFIALYRHVSGTTTQLGSNYARTVTVGQTVNLRLRVEGSVISVFVDGSPTAAITQTDGSPVTQVGKPGLHGYRSGFTRVFDIDNFDASTIGASDTAAPTLTSASATATGATTASGSVSTNESNGTLYWLASANPSESVATVKAGSSQSVTATGVQNVTVTGLAASNSYYLHFVHTDAAANDSTVATSAQFTTNAANTSPSFTGPNIADISGTEAVALTPVDVSAKFYDAKSSLTFSAMGSWPAGVTVSSAGVISGTPTTAGTYASLQVRATDADSLTADSNAFTITAASAAVKGVTVTLYNGSSLRASVTGIRALWWGATAPDGTAADFYTTTASTDASGVLTVDLDAATSLALGEYGYLLLHKDGTLGAQYKDAFAFAAALPVSDIS